MKEKKNYAFKKANKADNQQGIESLSNKQNLGPNKNLNDLYDQINKKLKNEVEKFKQERDGIKM